MGINKLKVVLTEEAQAFLDTQPFKAQQKIYYNIFKVEEGVMKVDIFKKLENTEIWEFRTLYNGICYRLFSFWDTEEETLVIATHGIVKKTQKTPLKEIAKAEEIRKEYFNPQIRNYAPNMIQKRKESASLVKRGHSASNVTIKTYKCPLPHHAT